MKDAISEPCRLFRISLKPGFAPIVSKCFKAIRTIGTIEAISGFHIIAPIVLKSDTAQFGPGKATLF